MLPEDVTALVEVEKIVLVRKIFSLFYLWLKSWRLSLFEKVIVANSLMLVGEALAGLWLTSHQLEMHHYFIDTSLVIIAALFSFLINFLLLRASFRPLFSLLKTIRMINTSQSSTRAVLHSSDTEISELAQAFNNMLDRLETARREQTQLILQAQEDERRRLALELHDETGQNLTALLIHTEVLQQNFQAQAAYTLPAHYAEQMNQQLTQLSQLTQMTLDNVRTLSQQLRPSVLDDLGLLAALRWLIEDAQQRFHLPIDFRADIPTTMLANVSPEQEIALFRIAQESLTNIARHAQAHRVTVQLTNKQDRLILNIQDDGCGFHLQKKRAGIGIIGMQERASVVGGILTLISQPGSGTTVQASIPLSSH